MTTISNNNRRHHCCQLKACPSLDPIVANRCGFSFNMLYLSLILTNFRMALKLSLGSENWDHLPCSFFPFDRLIWTYLPEHIAVDPQFVQPFTESFKRHCRINPFCRQQFCQISMNPSLLPYIDSISLQRVSFCSAVLTVSVCNSIKSPGSHIRNSSVMSSYVWART